MTERSHPNVTIRLLEEADLAAADTVMRLAFGTFAGLADPLSFMGDADYVRTRWRADPTAAFAALRQGELVGSNFVTNWGSVGLFGPITVRPDLWDQGIARRLLEPTMALFERWGTTHAGLYTYAESAKHVHLYQQFGFWPRFLTAIMARPITPGAGSTECLRFSQLGEPERAAALDDCRNVTDTLYPGLDLTREICSVAAQGLGDTLLLEDSGRLVGFAICHAGPGTEAGSESVFVKFGAVRPGRRAEECFGRLVDACAAFAQSQGAARLVAGVNTARERAYRALLGRGFHTSKQGVAMQRPNEPGYNRPDVFAIDDWR